MIEEIKEYLEPIIEFFEMIIDFIISLFEDTVYMIELTGETVQKIPDLFSWLPSELIVLLTSIIAVVVIYLILGRQ